MGNEEALNLANLLDHSQIVLIFDILSRLLASQNLSPLIVFHPRHMSYVRDLPRPYRL